MNGYQIGSVYEIEPANKTVTRTSGNYQTQRALRYSK